MGGDFQPVLIVPKEKRGPVLKRCTFGCLRGLHALNVTNGCSHYCVYCYARGYSQAPPKGVVELYVNLPSLLVRELDNPRRRVRPQLVVFNTATDCFQPHPSIQEVTFRAMEALLQRGIPISFLTKGEIGEEFFDLFKEKRGLVRAQIGLVSLSQGYWRRFEPGAAPPERRLQNIERLRRAGITAEVRIDPIIPFLTDGEGEMGALLKALRELGVRRVTLNYLHLRPAIEDNLRRELGSVWEGVLQVGYRNQPWRKVGTSTRSKLLPRPLRQRGYERIVYLARSLGMEATICSCKNPDLKGGLCIPPEWRTPQQLSLFSSSRGVQRQPNSSRIERTFSSSWGENSIRSSPSSGSISKETRGLRRS